MCPESVSDTHHVTDYGRRRCDFDRFGDHDGFYYEGEWRFGKIRSKLNVKRDKIIDIYLSSYRLPGRLSGSYIFGHNCCSLVSKARGRNNSKVGPPPGPNSQGQPEIL